MKPTVPAVFVPKQTSAAVAELQLVPDGDRAVVVRYRAFTRITSTAQLGAALRALRWLKRRIRFIEEHPRLNAVIEKRKADLEAARAVKRAALALYAPLEAKIRDEIARFRSAQHRQRERLQRQATKLAQQAQPKPRGIFVPQLELTPAPLTVAPLPKHGAGWREWWRWTLVNPKKPRDADDVPIENVEAGIKALCAAVVTNRAPWQLLTVDADVAQQLVDEHKGELAIPGLVAWVEARPILTPERQP